MTVEEWRPVAGYERLYQVSSEGRVRSLDRVVWDSRGFARPYRGCVLSPGVTREGYRTVVLHRDGIPATFGVHRLVAEIFHGERPQQMQVRHLNGDPGDNRAANLQYGTASENMRDRVRHGTDPNARKTQCPAGHPYDTANTYEFATPSGGTGRACRACRNERSKEHARRKKQAA